MNKIIYYYQTFTGLDFLEQNLSGTTPRKKSRLRWYGETFEKIYRHNKQVVKIKQEKGCCKPHQTIK